MAKFRYRMQNILDIKEKMENQAKTAYGMANAKLAAEQQKLQDILIRRAGYESKARKLVSGSINVLEIRECRKAIDVLKSKQRKSRRTIKHCILRRFNHPGKSFHQTGTLLRIPCL